jgi:hypothetical protein
MKRIFVPGIMILFVAMLMMMPRVSSAKTVVADQDLADVTAEAGVSIVFDKVTMGNNATTLTSLAIGDPNGFTGYTAAGWGGISNVTTAGNVTVMDGTMNIDIGTSGTSTRMQIVLPTMTMGTMNITAMVKAGTTGDLTASSNVLGVLDMRGFSTVTTGTIQVFAH